jgi:hypothetical protein
MSPPGGESGRGGRLLCAAQTKLASTSRKRATVLQLHALIEQARMTRHSQSHQRGLSRYGRAPPFSDLSNSNVELGSRYLERNRPRDAIICLQCIWSANRLLEHQQARLEDLKSKLQAAETGPRGDPYARIVLEQLISKMNREIANLRKIENFDAAVRLRLAAAYQAIGVIVNQPSSWNRWSKICHPTASWSRPPPILSNLGSRSRPGPKALRPPILYLRSFLSLVRFPHPLSARNRGTTERPISRSRQHLRRCLQRIRYFGVYSTCSVYGGLYAAAG